MLVPFALCKGEEIILTSKYWEDLEEFVEELKVLNKKWVDRREFSIRNGSEIIKVWNRK